MPTDNQGNPLTHRQRELRNLRNLLIDMKARIHSHKKRFPNYGTNHVISVGPQGPIESVEMDKEEEGRAEITSSTGSGYRTERANF